MVCRSQLQENSSLSKNIFSHIMGKTQAYKWKSVALAHVSVQLKFSSHISESHEIHHQFIQSIQKKKLQYCLNNIAWMKFSQHNDLPELLKNG